MMPIGRRLHLPVLALLLASAAACRDGGLESALSERYGPAIVDFAPASSRDLRVTFLDSPFAERVDAERRKTARKVAEYVRDHYLGYKGLDKVTVLFATRKETLAMKHIAASYTFTRAELGSPPPSAAPPADSGVPPGG
jgi:hypothetical protein